MPYIKNLIYLRQKHSVLYNIFCEEYYIRLNSIENNLF